MNEMIENQYMYSTLLWDVSVVGISILNETYKRVQAAQSFHLNNFDRTDTRQIEKFLNLYH